MTNPSDVTIIDYNSGNLKGKLALFFITDKAKQVYKTMLIDSLYCLAYDKSDTIMAKAEQFCINHNLHYELVYRN